MSKMAIGGNVGMEDNMGGDDKAKNKKADDKPRVRTIGQSGVDLTEDIIINKDPSQISKNVNYGAWNAFQNFLKKQTIDGEPFVGNPRLNTSEGKQLGQSMIDTWNASEYVKKFPQNKITPEQVQAVQQYHKLADPKVQTEGWFGSQTSRMRYPQPTVSYMEDKDKNIISKEGYVPVMWGNKQYVAPAASPEKIQTYEPYDPKKHANLLQKPIGSAYQSYANVYNQFVPKQNASVQPKKKGGMIKKYEDGGYILRAQNPGELQSMDVKDTELTELPSLASLYSKKSKLGKKDEIANTDGTKTETGVGESKPDLSGITSLGGELIGTGIDAYDRREGRSSIAGQSASGYYKGMAKGAAAGAAFGPLGMAIGAGIGGITGGISGAIKGKKEKKERLNTMQEEVRAAQESTDLDRRGPIKLKSYNEQDTKTGLAGLFAKGGTIKGAGTGTSDSIVTDINKKGIPEGSFITPAKNNEMAKGIRGMVLGDNPNKVAEFKKGGTPKSDKVAVSNGEHLFTPAEKEKIIKYLGKEILEKLAPEAEENEMEKKKGGEMIKRADGSYSKRGLWDNIRANKGSGKKPTPEMLKQEKKIIEEKAKGGYVVKRSSERKGKTHVVIGPDGTKKYFGDAKLGQHPNNPARKKAFYARHEKNLKKNPYFRAFARETWAEGGTVGSKMNKEMLESELMSKKAKGGNLTKAKAKEILHDKSVHGKPLTDKQRKYFGWVAGGKKNMGGIVGKYAMGGNVNKNFDWV